MQPDADPARRQLFRLAPSPEYPRSSQRTAAFSSDGRYLACGNPEGVISLLRLSARGQVPEITPLEAPAKKSSDPEILPTPPEKIDKNPFP